MKESYLKLVIILLIGVLNVISSLPMLNCIAAEDIVQMKAVVVKLTGDVRIKSRASLVWHDAKANEILVAGDRIETRKNGLVEIKIDNNNVVSLKPDSRITLSRLTHNLKTRDYENLLEAAKGKIRANVEKIKGDSKFEIKTPTAIAAVRGTIIYLDILPHLTTAFFEGGNGTFTNTFSNETRNIGDGESSSADNQGNVTESVPVPQEQRSQWESGWSVVSGAEGYTPPAGEGLPQPPEEPTPPAAEDPASPI